MVTTVQGLPLVPQAPAASPIAVMHARYEEAMRAAGALDDAQLKLGDSEQDKMLYARYDEARAMCEAQTDALRTALLYQMPSTWADALILQYHVYIAQDLYTPGKEPPHERAALIVAVDTLFDFMATEVDADHEQIGPQFKRGTMRVWNRRRFRAAELEG